MFIQAAVRRPRCRRSAQIDLDEIRPRLHARGYCFRHSQLTPTMLWSNRQPSGWEISQGSSTARRGDLVSQRREEANARPQASFDRNEGEDARCSSGASQAALIRKLKARASDLEKKLGEALEQQTATSEVLQRHLEFARRAGAGLSDHADERSTDLRSQVRRCPPRRRCFPRGRDSQCAARICRGTQPRSVAPPPPEVPLGRVVIAKKAVQIADMTTTQSYIERNPFVVSAVELGGYRTVLVVPMLKGNELIGAIAITRRKSGHSPTSRSSW